MYSTLKRSVQTAFTLVELLIVVVILAILAAIVIPQFSSSASDAREAALDSNLGTLRAAIELFKAQHGFYPGAKTAVGSACATGTIGAGAINTSAALIEHLTYASEATGGACTVSSTTFKFGPYLRKSMPNDPITGKGAASTEIVTTALGTTITATTAGGWAYDTQSGQILANNTAVDSGGTKKYSDH